jgi:V/A-type H+-transporting ATPase subunit I
MARVELLGPRDLLPQVIALVQEAAVLELRLPTDGAEAQVVHPWPEGPEAEEEEARLAALIRDADALRARLPGAGAASAETAPAPAERLAPLARQVDALEAQRAALRDEGEAIDRFVRVVVALAPLGHGVDPARHPEVHALVLRDDPDALALLEGEVRRITGGECEVSARPLEPGSTGVLVVVPRDRARELGALLRNRGVDEVPLPGACAGRPLVEVLLHLARRGVAIPREQARVEAALARLGAEEGPALAALAREAGRALSRLRARARCGATRFAFVIAGYMPVERVKALRAAVAARFGDRVALLARAPERARWPEVPVILRNRSLVAPFERLLALVPLPRYGSVDPTPWLALFFPALLGLVIGDAAFGLAGMVLAAVAHARGWGGALGRDVSVVAFACALSSLVFGVLFGEALGALPELLGIHPVLFDRRGAALTLLALAVGAGLVHVGVGLALGVLDAVREGERREAVFRAARLAVLCGAAAVAAAVAGVAPVLLRPALAAGAISCLVAVLAGGPMALLEVLLTLGNVLSYARLMALGLASVMLAEVANLVAGALEPAAMGLLLAIVLHLVNFTLGLMSAGIAALRLHYVEFFEKFYVEGGAPHRPLATGG